MLVAACTVAGVAKHNLCGKSIIIITALWALWAPLHDYTIVELLTAHPTLVKYTPLDCLCPWNCLWLASTPRPQPPPRPEKPSLESTCWSSTRCVCRIEPSTLWMLWRISAIVMEEKPWVSGGGEAAEGVLLDGVILWLDVWSMSVCLAVSGIAVKVLPLSRYLSLSLFL